MAFSQAPVQSTYSSHLVPLVHDLKLKPGNTAFSELFSGMTNVLPVKEDDKEKFYGETRFGLNMSVVVDTTAMSCRGFYVWEKTVGTTYYFVVVGNGTNTAVWTSTGGAFSSVNSWADSARTPCRFTEFISATNVKQLVLVTGTRGYTFTDNTAGTQITDADFPNPHIPFPIFLNGRIFLAKSATGDIYNSALNDPTSWAAGDFISSEVYPDDIQALVKVNNHILALGLNGGEYFYDNANPSGSPLARRDDAVLPFGTSSPNSIAWNKDTVMLLALNSDGDAVFKAIDGFKHAEVPASAVLTSFNAEVAAGRATSAAVRGCFLRQNGELYYLFNFKGDATKAAATTTPTVIYSFKTKMWSLLNLNNANTFPVFFTAGATSTSPVVTYVAGTHTHGVIYGTISASNVVDTINSINYDITQTMVVPPQSFGTMNQKFMHRLGVNYMYAGVESAADVTASYSDDGMETFSTARTLASTNYAKFPFLTQLGSFRKRGFSIVGTDAGRWETLEVDINKGQQ